jgi:hypothetical protein
MIESILFVYLMGCIIAMLFSAIITLFLSDSNLNWWNKIRFIFMWTFGWPILGPITYYRNLYK